MRAGTAQAQAAQAQWTAESAETALLVLAAVLLLVVIMQLL